MRRHDRMVLLEHARLIQEDGVDAAPNESDRETIRKRYEIAVKALRDEA